MKQIKAHDFKEVYKGFGINLSTLGCVMLDVEPTEIPTYIIQRYDDGSQVNYDTWIKENLYYAKDKTRFWIDGWVADKVSHVTLLYGLLETAKNYEWHIEQVLKGWKLEEVEVSDIDFFDSPYEDEPYYCIVAHIKTTPELIEGHQRLELLPHINTFAGYKPHMTIAYIRKDESFRDDFIGEMKKIFLNKKLKVSSGLNLGGNK